MPNIPSDSVPGPPYTRWKLGSTYEDMDPKPDATPDDIIARSIENFKKNATAAAVASERKERSSFDFSLFTRKGVYRVLENRFSA
jgi:hypothetical protein